MRRITAIEPQKRNLQRVNIFLDGDFAFGLARITAAWLHVGQELSEEKIAALQADDTREAVHQRALHFLSFRPRSTAEVRRNLEKHNIPEALVDETIERLMRNGLLNDRSFAQTWIENRNDFRPRGRSVLRLELRRKGIDEEIIQTALDGNVDEEILAMTAARKYARRLAGLEWPDFRRRLAGFLSRRGFTYAIIAPLIATIWQERQSENDG